MSDLLAIVPATNESHEETSLIEQRAIDQMLSRLYKEWRNLSACLCSAISVKLDREQLRNGPVGRDLFRLAAITRGKVTGNPEEVMTAVESVLQLLFWPAGARSYSVPNGFWQTDLGQMLDKAKSRATSNPERTAHPLMAEPDIADRLSTYYHP